MASAKEKMQKLEESLAQCAKDRRNALLCEKRAKAKCGDYLKLLEDMN